MSEKAKHEQDDPILTEAKQLWDKGFAIHWLLPRQKRPVNNGSFSRPRESWDKLQSEYVKDYNVGVRLGSPSKLEDGNYLACIDVDVKMPEARDIAYAKLREITGKELLPRVASGRGNGSMHLYCVTSKPFKMITIEKHKEWEICIYSDGRQMVLPPSIHPDTGQEYKWVRHPNRLPVMDFTKWEAEPKVKSEKIKKEGIAPASVIDFELRAVELSSIPVSEKMRQAIRECVDPTTGQGIEDRSAFLLVASDALYAAGLDRNEVLSVLSDRRYDLGKCAYEHTGSNDRAKAMQWLWKYTVSKIEDQRSQKPPSESQSTKLAAIADDLAELFHTSDGDEYGSVEINGHTETYAIKSQQFRKWLIQEYRRRHRGCVPGSQGIQDALAAIGAKALYDGAEKEVHLRIAKHDGKIYIDLCNSEWEAVEIDTEGWRVVNKSPVRFRRANGMQPLPRPVAVGHEGVAELRKVLHVGSDSDFRLLVAWLMNCLNPNGPYIILVLYAEQGAGKSTLLKMLRDLVDPNASPLRREPRNTDDLLVSAKSNWVIAVDNMLLGVTKVFPLSGT